MGLLMSAMLENVLPGTHLCSIYRNKEEQFSAVVPFIKGGLNYKKKCIYIADENTSEEVSDRFKKNGVDLSDHIGSGQFQFVTRDDSYLKDGYFDPDRMISLLDETLRRSLEEGFDGLRGTGEMTWALSGMPGTDRLIEYESKLNLLCPSDKISAICQYNENRFDEDALLEVIYTHPKILLYGKIYNNPFFIPPWEFREIMSQKQTKDNYRSVVDNIVKTDRMA